MFCPACGTNIPEDSKFCFRCGKEIALSNKELGAVTRSSKEPIEWEYFTFERQAPKGQPLDVVVDAEVNSEAASRLTFWYKHEADIRESIQRFLDDAWQPVVELGPGCLVVTTSAEHSKGALQTLLSISALGYNWWLVGIRIKFRRPKGAGKLPAPTRTRDNVRGQVLGKWALVSASGFGFRGRIYGAMFKEFEMFADGTFQITGAMKRKGGYKIPDDKHIKLEGLDDPYTLTVSGNTMSWERGKAKFQFRRSH